MACVLYCWKCEIKVQLMYGWNLIFFKRQKYSTAGVLIYSKCQNKVQLGAKIVGNAKKGTIKVRIESYIAEKEKLRHI